jgi:hypothetical protein
VFGLWSRCGVRRPTPRPVLGSLDQPCLDRIRQHVLDRVVEVVLVVDHPGGEALCEERAAAAAACVGLAGVVAVEPVEGAGERICGPGDDRVVMRSQRAVGVKRQPCPAHSASEVADKEVALGAVQEQHRLGDRIGGDVEVAAWEVGTPYPSHLPTLDAPGVSHHPPSHSLDRFDTLLPATASVRHSPWPEGPRRARRRGVLPSGRGVSDGGCGRAPTGRR